MDPQRVRDIMSGRARGAAAALLRGGTWPLSKPYAGLMRLRRRLYRLGALGARKAPVPVVSVGNITTGGTGKTPMVVWLVRLLRDNGRAPAVLTRGYRPAADGPDEARMIFEATGAPVVADADRVAAAEAAAEAGADVLVMDDGFQHRRLRRDLDIVLIDATCPFGYGHCLPRGMLREPLSALRDADAIVITRCDQAPLDEVDALAGRLERLAPAASLHRAGHVPAAVVVGAGRHAPSAYLRGRKLCAFCGIGNPGGFFATLAEAGAEVAATVVFQDHVCYGPGELERIGQAAKACGAEAAITTAKDRIKLTGDELPVPLWTLRVEMGVSRGRAELTEKVLRAVGAG